MPRLRAVLRAASWLACLGANQAVAGAPAAPAVQADSAAAISPQRARSLYLLHCAGCHQVDGSGAPQFGVPTMIDTLGYFQRTRAGRAFLVQVPGARNSNVSDAELAALTNWALRTFSQSTLPQDFKPYSTAEVAHWRADPPLDIATARETVIAGLPVQPAYAGASSK